jgi:hypothetical protein
MRTGERLKSLFQYNDLPAENGESVKAWFYGKLLRFLRCVYSIPLKLAHMVPAHAFPSNRYRLFYARFCAKLEFISWIIKV